MWGAQELPEFTPGVRLDVHSATDVLDLVLEQYKTFCPGGCKEWESSTPQSSNDLFKAWPIEKLIDYAVQAHELFTEMQKMQAKVREARRQSTRVNMLDSIKSMTGINVVHTDCLHKFTDEEGVKTINDYVIVDELGQGSFGKVKLAYCPKRGKKVAIKIVKRPVACAGLALNVPRQAKLQALQREIAVMKKLKHKNIVALYEVIDDPETDKLYLVMQYVDNGPIATVNNDGTTSRCFTSSRLADYARQLCAGLHYLHRHQIAHRDIKPENILVSKDNEVFFSDFGVSEMLSETKSVHNFSGTVLFLSPELLHITCDEKILGPPLDVWALGVTFYALLVGRLPFTSKEEILSSEPEYPTTWVSADWKAILKKMLQKDPKRRAPISEIRENIKELQLGFSNLRFSNDLVDVQPEEIDRAFSPLVSTQTSSSHSAGLGPGVAGCLLGSTVSFPGSSMRGRGSLQRTQAPTRSPPQQLFFDFASSSTTVSIAIDDVEVVLPRGSALSVARAESLRMKSKLQQLMLEEERAHQVAS